MQPRRRFQDGRSELVWAAIETLPPGVQHELLRELATLFALSARNPRTEADKVRAAVCDLHEVAEILGRTGSLKEYRAIRARLPELGLRPDGTIRRWLAGSWNECLKRALLDTVTDGDFVARHVGVNDRFEDEEILQALRECSSELGYAPAMTEYLRWARRPDVRERPGRRPLSYKPFERFGGIGKALVAAGVISKNGGRYAANGRVIPSGYRYDDQDIIDALLMVARRLGRSPRPSEYERERQRIYAELLANGEIRTLPTVDVIRKRYGFWNAALAKAGLAELEHSGEPHLGLRRPSYSEAEKLEWIRRAWAELGEPFTATSYKRWRLKEIAKTDAAVPSLAILERTFGGWKHARARALPGQLGREQPLG